MSATTDHNAAVPVALEVQEHPLLRRIAHWSIVVSVLVMTGSGWRIYNGVPILPFTFPDWLTLGGDWHRALIYHNDGGFGTAVAYHLAGLWLLLFGVTLYIAHSLLTGHFRRDLLPVGPKSFLHDFIAAATFKLAHKLGEYNAVQKVFYFGVLACIVMMLLTGAVLWKPVQFQGLTALFGGFQSTRVLHFLFMSLIVGFIFVHVALVAIVPKTLVAMVTGRATARPHAAHQAAQGPMLEGKM